MRRTDAAIAAAETADSGPERGRPAQGGLEAGRPMGEELLNEVTEITVDGEDIVCAIYLPLAALLTANTSLPYLVRMCVATLDA